MKNQVCSGGLLVNKKKFLFGKRSNKKTWAPGVWDIAGGKGLKNEHPMYTLSREIREELGITVINAELLTSLDIMDHSKKEFFKYHIYLITDYKGKPANCSDEHTKIKWFTREQLNKVSLALPQYLILIDEWLNRKH